MGLQIDAVHQACRAIALQMRDYTRTLNLSFIVHREGEKLEALSMAGQQLLTHPAGESAMRLMRDQGKGEHSSYIGLAVWKKNILLGLLRDRQMMALTTINIDNFQSLREIRSHAWHMAWHAIRHYQLKDDSEYENLFDEGIVRPLYDETSLPAANLRADIFSAIMCNIDGDLDAVRRLAHDRCSDSLSCTHGHAPENYPFPLALEATQAAVTDMLQRPPSKKRQIHAALDMAEKIAREYGDETLQQWIQFCLPAQEMAWRGDPQELILSAAVCTPQNTYIRTTGFLVSDILHIVPASVLALEDHHSPFAEDRYNQRVHQSMIERAFEKAASAGNLDRSGRPFLDAANEQNTRLSQGHIFGWCAVALQAAGRAFDSAMASGSKTPALEARRQFELEQHRTTWDSLKELGESIIEQYRHGYAVTFSDILEFCDARPAFAGISSSIAFTIKDPGYLKKLNVANDHRPPEMKQAFQPAAASPRGPAPASAAPRMPAPAPGGGGSPARQQQRPAPPPPDTPAESSLFEFEDHDSK